MRSKIRIQSEDFSLTDEVVAITAGRRDLGAIVTFTGLCRDEGGVLATLELEHYPGMAEQEIARAIAEAGRRWPLQAATVVHRYGQLKPGDQIVLVVTASSHRSAAFCAAVFVMDFLKTQAPFWKRQKLVDGTSGGWVDATEADEEATRRWSAPEWTTAPSGKVT